MPRNIDLYWFIPALAKRSVESDKGTTEDEGTVEGVSSVPSDSHESYRMCGLAL